MSIILVERLADGTGLLAPARRAIRLPAGWTVVDNPLGVLTGTPNGPGQVTGYLQLVPPAGGGSGQIDLVTGSVSAVGAGAPIASVDILPSADFPGATKATLYALLWCDVVAGVTPAWAASTSYSASPPPSIVQNPTGAGGQPVAYVCTTGGTSSGAHGPTGIGTGLQDAGGSACRWNSARAQLQVLTGNPTASPTVIADLTNSYTLGAAFASVGASLLGVGFDLSSALIPLTSRTLLTLQLAGDPTDTGGTAYTKAWCSRARIVFS